MSKPIQILALAGFMVGSSLSLSAMAARGINYVNIEPQLIDCSYGAIPCPGEDPPEDESNVIRVVQTEDGSGNLVYSHIETNSHWDDWVWLGTKIEAQCSGIFRLNHASMRVGSNYNSVHAGNIMGLPVNPHNKTIPWRHVNFHAPLADIIDHKHSTIVGDDLIAFGNDYIDDMVALGEAEAEVRAQTFHFNALVPVSLSIKCFRQGLFSEYALGYDTYDMPIRIEFVGQESEPQGQGGELPDPPRVSLTGQLQVTQAELFVFPDEQACAVDLSIVFVATGATNIQYRLVNDLGIKSQVFQVPVDKTFSALVNHSIDLTPEAPDNELDFVPLQPQPGGAIDDYAHEESDNVQGYYQVEVIYPHYKLSAVDSYNMNCDTSSESSPFGRGSLSSR